MSEPTISLGGVKAWAHFYLPEPAKSNVFALVEAVEALETLHAEVEMAESVGICLPNRTPSLRAGSALARFSDFRKWEASS